MTRMDLGVNPADSLLRDERDTAKWHCKGFCTIPKRCATRQDLSLKNGPDPASRQSVLMTARGVKDSATGLSSSIWNAITHERQRNRAGEAVLVDLNFGAGACFEIQFRLPYVMRE